LRRPRWNAALLSITLAASGAAVTSGAPPAAAAPSSALPGAAFSTSFEAGDPEPTWTDTVDLDAKGAKRTLGIDGATASGIPGGVRDQVAEISVSGEPNTNEGRSNLNDGDPNSKWLVDQTSSWAQYTLTAPTTIVRYALTSANDAPDRDPKNWSLQGSTDGVEWTTLDTRTNEVFGERFQQRIFDIATPAEFKVYRLSVASNGGSSLTQLAELQLSVGDTAPPPASDMKSRVGTGPASSPTAKANAGFTGLKAFQIAGKHVATGRAYSYNKIADVDVPVTKDTELSYLIFPEFTRDDLSNPATYTAVDLIFTDGTSLSNLKPVDQHGAPLTTTGQGVSETLYTSQWNAKRSRIGAVAAGKTIDRIIVAYDKKAGPTSFRTWFDDITIADVPASKPKSNLSEYVETRRGTNSSGGFSRGNNFPAAAVPHGFNFWTPVTDAGSNSWLYEYHRKNNADNLPTLQAFALSHEPSPWMGERQTFQVMPGAATAAGTVPNASRTARALPFRHADETARADYYGVTFDNGIKTEIAPTDHAAQFRFTFTGDSSNLIFDNIDANSGLTIDAENRTITGYSDNRSGLSTGATRMFVYATVDKAITASGLLAAGNRPSTGYAQFDTSTDKAVTMRIATSLISIEQAKKNLALELDADDTIASVSERAQKLWNAKLRTVEVEGASEDQLVTMYSNLYRLFLYPNSGHENVGTKDAPVIKHAVQSSTTTPPSTPTETGAPIKDGKVYVNNGFWDTYRTTWPAYSLLTPKTAGELVEGFVQQYKDGGWISRWSSPGYANLMVGTSSDVAFADAYLKGVKGFDADAAYAAALKNASVAPPNGNVGRKGFESSVFKGWTPSNATGEAMSWAMDGYINDFGVSNMAAAKAKAAGTDAKSKKRYTEEAEYFRNRALNYVNMFDPAATFFQGRDSAGNWRVPADSYDPREWGHDYTETNGWNMAFHVPQDGQGLANLYGGKAGLAKKLDTFFSTPETAGFPGSYGGVIHEMIEARDVRMGQYGHSNQPSHHIPYMYNVAGEPSKTQALVREATSRLYLGSEIGQGYAGDEDNGEMSAWQIFSSLGFYPLQMGSPAYAIGSPLFTKATLNLEGGKKVVVNAPANSAKNIYVQGLKVNGKAWTSTSLPHEILAKGGTLDFAMGAKPSTWGTGAADAPPSITAGSAVARPLRDIIRPSAVSAADAALVDDTSATRATFVGPTSSVQVNLTGTRERADFYTLTSGAVAGDVTSWTLNGSFDGKKWSVIDSRTAQEFDWRLQTRPFKIAKPGRYAHYRLDVLTTSGTTSTTLAEYELLARAPQACTTTIANRVVTKLAITSGVTCLTNGATVSGSIAISKGASLYATDATVKGSITVTNGGNVSLLRTTVKGKVTSTKSSTFAVENSTVTGVVTVTGTKGASVISANRITGLLICTGNTSVPVNNGLANTIQGGRRGQCVKL
jgi:predicted alpha-1,2-mannosidase